MAVPALENGNESIIDRMKAEGQLTRNTGTNSLKVVINTLNKIFDILNQNLSTDVTRAQDAAAKKFASEEEDIEKKRRERSELGGRVAGGVTSGAKKALGFLERIFRALVAPALLAFLAFLPEILDSKLFKEALKFMKGPLKDSIVNFKDGVLAPLAKYFTTSLTELLKDINDPKKTKTDVIVENAGILTILTGLAFRKTLLAAMAAILGAGFTWLAGAVSGAAIGASLMTALTTAAAWIGPQGVFALAAIAVGALVLGLLKIFDEETYDKIMDGTYKDRIKKASKEFADRIVAGFLELVDGFKLTFATLLGNITAFFGGKTVDQQARAFGVSRETQANIEIAYQNRKIDSAQGQIDLGKKSLFSREKMTKQIEEATAEIERLKQARTDPNMTITPQVINTDAKTIVTSISNAGGVALDAGVAALATGGFAMAGVGAIVR